jgi:hypothetical protein
MANPMPTAVESARRKDACERLGAVLAESYLVTCELYCDQPECPVREIEVRVKDHDATLLVLVKNNGYHCPLCGKPAKMHWAMTFQQADAQEKQRARESVNLQMRHRDRCVRERGPDALEVWRGDQMCDDRLPPTPDDWFGPDEGAPAPRQFVSGTRKDRL